MKHIINFNKRSILLESWKKAKKTKPKTLHCNISVLSRYKFSRCLTWHMPHWIVSNCRLSVETVRDGSVTTAHSSTCTVGPCRTCEAKKVLSRTRSHLHILILFLWIGNHGHILKHVNVCNSMSTCIGMTTLMSPIFWLDPWESNLTVNVCVSPQGRFFTCSNSTVKPEKTQSKFHFK